ncbi:MAG: peptidase C13 [Hydrogenophilaceae bacterium]|jgi:hypothetical protein|nr:peptidase C13 [Hydrogenophilaceae bacterium]
MLKKGLAAALALGLALCATASAQQSGAQRDPLGGNFGALELALSPRAAAQQQRLFAEALGALQPGRPGRADVYLLVAGFWSDPVFESEAREGAAILSRDLGAAGRTIVLTGGVGAPGDRAFPAATPYHLNAAIGRIGELIDPSEDLVVLFLTSHGYPDGGMAIREHNRMQGVLRPVHLRDALADAGIRTRVVIVSSCFAGAFIPPLMDENTIVLTAAAHNRTSFGCQPTRDWTYFGDAFLSQAVRNGAGLIAGFDAATRTIAQWESEQGLTPSQPQKHVGPRAAALLARVERDAR